MLRFCIKLILSRIPKKITKPTRKTGLSRSLLAKRSMAESSSGCAAHVCAADSVSAAGSCSLSRPLSAFPLTWGGITDRCGSTRDLVRTACFYLAIIFEKPPPKKNGFHGFFSPATFFSSFFFEPRSTRRSIPPKGNPHFGGVLLLSQRPCYFPFSSSFVQPPSLRLFLGGGKKRKRGFCFFSLFFCSCIL